MFIFPFQYFNSKLETKLTKVPSLYLNLHSDFKAESNFEMLKFPTGGKFYFLTALLLCI